MSTKFTPGEWRVSELTRRFGVYDSSGTSIAKIEGAYGVAMERRKADANLIAAAPTMYAALERAEDLLASQGLEGDHGAALGAVRAALKKARNEL